MGQVKTNNIILSVTPETAVLGVLPAQPVWTLLEPNSIGTYGATITTVARDPLSRSRQRRKGTITDLDSAVDFEADLTLSHFNLFAEGFVFANAVNKELTIGTTAAVATTDDYTVASLTSDQAAKIQFTAAEIATLFHVRGFSTAANNGLKTVNVQPVATDTIIQVSETLVAETAPANAVVELAGLRALAASTDLTWTYNGGTKRAVLTSGTVTDWADLGISLGMQLHIGSPDGAGGSTNAFENLAANDMFGYGRVVSIDGASITLDKLSAALAFTDATSPTTAVDILFGQFIRNVPTDDADYLEQSFQFELLYPGLDNPSGDMAEYALGNFCNEMVIGMPLTDKATIGLGFIGTDTPVPTASRKTNAATPLLPVQTGAFNTTSDCLRLGVSRIDETGLTTDFKNVTLTIGNGITPEKVLCVLGARFMNANNLAVNIEAQALFTDSRVSDAVRNNETLTMAFGLKNDDGAIYFDIPAMTLGGGDKEFPVGETVLINIPGEAFEDPILGTSIGISIFPIVP